MERTKVERVPLRFTETDMPEQSAFDILSDIRDKEAELYRKAFDDVGPEALADPRTTIERNDLEFSGPADPFVMTVTIKAPRAAVERHRRTRGKE